MRAISLLQTVDALRRQTSRARSFQQVCGHADLSALTSAMLDTVGDLSAMSLSVDLPKVLSGLADADSSDDDRIDRIFRTLADGETAVDSFDATAVDALESRGRLRVVDGSVCVPLGLERPDVINWLELAAFLAPELDRIADAFERLALKAAADDHRTSAPVAALFHTLSNVVAGVRDRLVHIVDRRHFVGDERSEAVTMATNLHADFANTTHGKR